MVSVYFVMTTSNYSGHHVKIVQCLTIFKKKFKKDLNVCSFYARKLADYSFA